MNAWNRRRPRTGSSFIEASNHLPTSLPGPGNRFVTHRMFGRTCEAAVGPRLPTGPGKGTPTAQHQSLERPKTTFSLC